MKIGIIGSGCSAIYLACILKAKDFKNDVSLLDINFIPGKKFLITGNGRCNLANTLVTNDSYNNDQTKKIIGNTPAKDIISFLGEVGILTRDLGNLIYPFSLSAQDYLSQLIRFLKERNTKFINDFNVLDYQETNKGIKIIGKEKCYVFDKVIIATGGLSKINLKQRTNMFNILKTHKYSISPVKPGLNPIKSIENVKSLENLRAKGDVKLFIDNKEIYKESGEVQFKKDGLSGIAIFNCSSVIARYKDFKVAKISIDLMPDHSEEQIIDILKKFNNASKYSCLDGLFAPKFSEFIRQKANVKNLYLFTNSEISKLATTIKNLIFTFKEAYGFEDSQVTIGGVSYSNLSDTLESKIEKNIYFIGEVLDADGLCGGYNLMFAFKSAELVSKNL